MSRVALATHGVRSSSRTSNSLVSGSAAASDDRRAELQKQLAALAREVADKQRAAAALSPNAAPAARTDEADPIQKLRAQLGVHDAALPGRVRIDVIGDPPDNGVASTGGDSKETVTAYVQTVVDAVRLLAPDAQFVFHPAVGNTVEGLVRAVRAVPREEGEEGPDLLLFPYSAGRPDPLVESALGELIAAGIAVVVPAGNNARRAEYSEEFAKHAVVAAAIDASGVAAPFSSSVPGCVWAPGSAYRSVAPQAGASSCGMAPHTPRRSPPAPPRTCWHAGPGSCPRNSLSCCAAPPYR
jgi:hypothetical protein